MPFEMRHTPATRPLSPSMKLTAFITITIEKRVMVMLTPLENPVSSPSGSV